MAAPRILPLGCGMMRRLGLSKIFPSDMPIVEALAALRHSAAPSMIVVEDIALTSINRDAGFVTLEAIGPVSADDAAWLDEFFGATA